MLFGPKFFKCTPLFRHLALTILSRRSYLHLKPIIAHQMKFKRTSNFVGPPILKGFCTFDIGKNKFNVQHDHRNNRFIVEIDGVGKAYLKYEKEGDFIRITQTQVPPKLKGFGLGTILAKAALDYIAENDLKMDVDCDFVKDVIKKYAPKYNKYFRK